MLVLCETLRHLHDGCSDDIFWSLLSTKLSARQRLYVDFWSCAFEEIEAIRSSLVVGKELVRCSPFERISECSADAGKIYAVEESKHSEKCEIVGSD
jgi:hypothetical protein